MIDIFGIIGRPNKVGIIQLVRPRSIRKIDSRGITNFYLTINDENIELYSRYGDPLQWMRMWGGRTFTSFEEARNLYPNAIRLDHEKFNEMWLFYKFEEVDL